MSMISPQCGVSRAVAAAAILSPLALPSLASAQDPAPSSEPTTQSQADPAQPQPLNQGSVSLSAGVDFTNAYFFRGLFQEDQGFICQPWIEANFNLIEKLDLSFGIWNSFHDAKTLATANALGPDWWYESDLYVGLTFTALPNTSLGLTYTAYTSPSDAFATIQEFSFSASYDDAPLWEKTPLKSGLQPSISIAVELDGQADGGSNEGVFLALAISPSIPLIESGDYPLTLNIPLTVGFSLGDYYEDINSPGKDDDSTFGYLDVGLILSMPLAFIPPTHGAWEVSLAGHYLLLTESTESYNNNEGDEFLATLSIGMSY